MSGGRLVVVGAVVRWFRGILNTGVRRDFIHRGGSRYSSTILDGPLSFSLCFSLCPTKVGAGGHTSGSLFPAVLQDNKSGQGFFVLTVVRLSCLM